MTVAERTRTPVYIAWAVVLLTAFAGYSLTIAPGERHIREIASHTHGLYQLANRNDQILGQSAGLIAARERVAADVSRLSAVKRVNEDLLESLRLLQAATVANHVVVMSFSPSSDDVREASDAVQRVTIVVQGSYENVLTAIAGLSRRTLLLEVDDAALAASTDGAAGRELTATVHASIYHNVRAIFKESKGVISVAH